MKELHGTISHLRVVVDLHRKHALITCSGNCWCWAAEAVCLAYEGGLTKREPDYFQAGEFLPAVVSEIRK